MPADKLKIKLGKTHFLVIDLSEPLKENTEAYPGDPVAEKIVFSDILKTGCQHHIYKIGDHSFHPHGDAPKHQNINMQNKGFEVFGLDYCFNSACLIDLSESPDTKKFNGIRYLTMVKKEHLQPFAKLISHKGAVVIRTGYDTWLEKNKPHVPENIPYLSRDAAEFLASFKNIKVVGTDSLTVDACRKSEPVHDAHRILKDKMIVESMLHLYEIPLKSKGNFYLQTSPVKIVGATGGPVVAYAFIEI